MSTPGLLARADSLRTRIGLSEEQLIRSVYCVQACDGIPSELLTTGAVLKLSRYLHQVQTEVEFLRDVREIQARMIREAGGVPV